VVAPQTFCGIRDTFVDSALGVLPSAGEVRQEPDQIRHDFRRMLRPFYCKIAYRHTITRFDLASAHGKYTIGLTGNIATGKSVVRRMLEHLGAYTIDADGLSHRATAKGAPGYEPVVGTFGRWILDAGGEIDRNKLGGLVFRDHDALTRLEAIVHPLVREAVDVLIRRSTQPVIVVEAIKLLEGELRDRCNSIWVTYAPPALQVERLMASRHMSREEAQQRIAAQSSQTGKLSQADVVIRNEGTYDDLWRQVEEAWNRHVPSRAPAAAEPTPASLDGTLSVKRGKPQDAAAIAEFLNRLGRNGSRLTADDIMAQFGEKAYMLLHLDRRLVGIAGWQVENLVVRTSDLHLEPGVDLQKALGLLMQEIEAVSADLQCEASLVFPKMQLASDSSIWERLGYRPRTPEELAVEAWTDAARESMPADTILLFKQMRRDRILRPI
jgi:dephospho-CoA kinase